VKKDKPIDAKDVVTTIIVKVDKQGATNTNFSGKHIAKHTFFRVLRAVQLGYRETIVNYRRDTKTLKRKNDELKAKEQTALDRAKEQKDIVDANAKALRAAKELVAANK
jgi:hypothetical protein